MCITILQYTHSPTDVVDTWHRRSLHEGLRFVYFPLDFFNRGRGGRISIKNHLSFDPSKSLSVVLFHTLTEICWKICNFKYTSAHCICTVHSTCTVIQFCWWVVGARSIHQPSWYISTSTSVLVLVQVQYSTELVQYSTVQYIVGSFRILVQLL